MQTHTKKITLEREKILKAFKRGTIPIKNKDNDDDLGKTLTLQFSTTQTTPPSVVSNPQKRSTQEKGIKILSTKQMLQRCASITLA